ncbi:MAG: hypothetical protein K2K93_00195 [Muribaculaceae bacterium]|nr:hypothetical protein [Muribaculaceae bacterium]
MKLRINPGAFIGPIMALSILGMALDSDANLKVHSVEGNVKVNKIAAQKGTEVKKSDRLDIPNDGEVKIHDTDNKKLYKNVSKGNMTVESMIAAAEEESKLSILKIIRTIKDNLHSIKETYSSRGASQHITHDVVAQPIDLPEGMSYLRYLMTLKSESQYDTNNDFVLFRREFNDPGKDSSFKFAFLNDLDTLVYVNVIDMRPEEDDIQFYFPVNPLIKPYETTVIEDCEYYTPGPAAYIAIASEKNFTIEDVKKLLDSEYHPEENYYFSILITDDATEQ